VSTPTNEINVAQAT